MEQTSNVAFTDAVARARQIAAKLGTGNTAAAPGASNGSSGGGFVTSNPLTGGLPDKGNPNNMPLGVKRPFPGGSGDEDSSAKKPAGEPDAITAQLRALADQQRTSAKDAAKIAAEQVAAKLNQSIGVAGAVTGGGVGPHAGLGLVVSEEWAIPNRVVGLVIGSKGESITQIQAQSGCRIQIAPDPPPGQTLIERQVSLNGTADSIAKAKDLINKTINEAGHTSNGGIPSDQGGEFCLVGQTTTEMMIPGNKVGLVIGKGGDTIKQLQAKSNCKMMMVQDGPYQTSHEKPLRITGDASNIESAKRMVTDLMNSKDLPPRGPPGVSGFNQYGDAGLPESVPVPREAVGIIIGKGGDMIKNIQGKFNVRVQFQNDTGGPQRICDISGAPNDVFAAKQHVLELISDSEQRSGGLGGMGRGGGAPRGGRGGFGGGGPPRGYGGPGGPGGEEQTSMRVPSERCGIVIGKGGENIRSICEMSGAHVELNRNAPPGPDKEFTIRGSAEQIQHAMHLIGEKISIPPRGPGGPGGGPGGAPGWGGPPQGGPYGGGGGGPPGWSGGHGGPGGPPQQQAQQGWGNYNYNQWGQGQGQTANQQAPGTGQAATGEQQQSNDSAWQAYYAQYYAQYQQPGSQQSQSAQPGQPAAGGAPQAAAAPTSAAAAPATSAQPKINPATGQPDYSEQWAAYYRQMGYHDQADAILKQAQQQSGQAPAQ
ncbi:FUBP1 [Bugula neritina]|uniref:FUBP1 n=1 Tax=Bugula neritina TaxID=10212 RepID=A0A7J7JHF5_BUGNE|nr:FUBP1 [Bugula neritina]